MFGQTHFEQKYHSNDRGIANDRKYVHKDSENFRVEALLHGMNEIDAQLEKRLHVDCVESEDNDEKRDSHKEDQVHGEARKVNVWFVSVLLVLAVHFLLAFYLH